jgi:hypothetical protein
MMEAVSTSEMSVSSYKTTQHSTPEDSHLHTHHQENLKSHMMSLIVEPECATLLIPKPTNRQDPEPLHPPLIHPAHLGKIQLNVIFPSP